LQGQEQARCQLSSRLLGRLELWSLFGQAQARRDAGCQRGPALPRR
jgi:hypothetical protein